MKKSTDTTPIMTRMIQKSPGCPTMGVVMVFMPNIEVKRVSGKVMKAKMVNIFMTSFCLVVSSELLVSRKSSIVLKRAYTLRFT